MWRAVRLFKERKFLLQWMVNTGARLPDRVEAGRSGRYNGKNRATEEMANTTEQRKDGGINPPLHRNNF